MFLSSSSSLSLSSSDLQVNRSSPLAHRHLTEYERRGLHVAWTFLNNLKEKSIPEDLQHGESLLAAMEVEERSTSIVEHIFFSFFFQRLLLEHQSDDSQLAFTGQSLLHYHYHPDHPYSFDSVSFESTERECFGRFINSTRLNGELRTNKFSFSSLSKL